MRVKADAQCLAPWSGGHDPKVQGRSAVETAMFYIILSVPLSRYLRSCRDSGYSLRNVPRRAEAEVPSPRKLTIKGAKAADLSLAPGNDVVSPRTALIYGPVNRTFASVFTREFQPQTNVATARYF